LKELLLWIFISSQISTPVIAAHTDSLLATLSRNRTVLEEIFKKVTQIETLATRLLYFISEAFKTDLKADNSGFLGWAVEAVKVALRTGAYAVPDV
jgi:nucleolar MIF4G domain-containing protein 1